MKRKNYLEERSALFVNVLISLHTKDGDLFNGELVWERKPIPPEALEDKKPGPL